MTLQTAVGVNTIEGQRPPISYSQLTSLSAATALTVPSDCHAVLIQAETQNVRWRDDGTDPTASVGMLLYAGDFLWYNGVPGSLKFIQVSASAKLNVTFYK